MVCGKKKFRMKRSIVICITALSLGLVLWKVPGHRIDSAREHNDRVIPLSHGTLIRQSFPVYHNGLYEVELGNLVNKAITRPDTDQELFAFTLFDSRHTA